MNDNQGQTSYASRRPLDRQIRAAAVYCSDGRFAAQVDDFLHDALGLTSCDRLAVPGGPAFLVGYPSTGREEETHVEQLLFLVDAHQLSYVALIAHEDCAFYTQKLGVPVEELESRQREDLRTAVDRLRGLRDGLRVDAFYARIRQDRVAFEAWFRSENPT